MFLRKQNYKTLLQITNENGEYQWNLISHKKCKPHSSSFYSNIMLNVFKTVHTLKEYRVYMWVETGFSCQPAVRPSRDASFV